MNYFSPLKHAKQKEGSIAYERTSQLSNIKALK